MAEHGEHTITREEATRLIDDRLGSPDPPAYRPPLGQYAEVTTTPAAPAKGAIIYCVPDNGSGKRQLRALFPTGAAQVIATEP